MMLNVHQVLQQKEEDLERVRQEVEALRLVAPLLAGKAAAPVTPIHESDSRE
jgi:hypothetical protein